VSKGVKIHRSQERTEKVAKMRRIRADIRSATVVAE
jgi:hypothetical protein